MDIHDADATLIKGGEQVVEIRLRRSIKGLSVSTKVHHMVEDLLRSWGTGEAIEVKQFGRMWLPVGDRPLSVYQLSQNPGFLPCDDSDGTSYRLDQPGNALLHDGRVDGGSGEIINLAMLRLVGASEENGVTFHIKAVNTPDEIDRIAKRIKNAARRFYVTFLKPVDVTVQVSIQRQ